MSGTEPAYGPTCVLRDVLYWASVWSYGLARQCPACNLMTSDLNKVRPNLVLAPRYLLRARYAMSGTDVRYAPRRRPSTWY
eukprot:1686433-Rhodomonas_salina.2